MCINCEISLLICVCVCVCAAAAGLQTVDDEKEEQTSYLELRAEAALHAKLRAENFMKAAHARGRKQWEVAQYYAQQVSGCGVLTW